MMLFTFFKGSTLTGKAEWGRDNMNQGPNAIAWLGGISWVPSRTGRPPCNVSRSASYGNNNGKLDMIVYRWKNGSAGFQDNDYGDGGGGIVVLWPTAT